LRKAAGLERLLRSFKARRSRWFLALGWGMGLGIALGAFTPGPCRSQQTPPRELQSPGDAAEAQEDDPLPTMFPRGETGRLWISGQANFVSQWHPTFHSPYQGINSLPPEAQNASSRLLTLFLALRLRKTTQLVCDVQEAGGHGIGEALGLAGATNLDVVRNPQLSKAPYVARLMWDQIIPLGPWKPNSRSALSPFAQLPERRLELRFGKMSLADFFDLNSFGTDTNFQFLNWTVDNNGAYDYAADTRGFTFAALIEYYDKRFAVRFAEALMPKVANGIHLDADVGRARAENVEFEVHGNSLGRPGVLRFTSFINHANMGTYRRAVDDFLAGTTPLPDITAHALATRVKYGLGINAEQSLNNWFGVFARWGWNEGQHESFAYTEVDATVEAGAGVKGKRWGRRFDRAGAVFVSNGISREHQRYLALGGHGFLLGDGRLTYGRENIVETFYTLHAWRGIYPAIDLQHIVHPGYNRDRGPVTVVGLRLHLEF
jgi:high affinity Mn2+ porin